MTDKIVILVTAPNRREAKKIARYLVEERLAACVNIASPVESLYRWKGKITEDREFLMVIKSSRDLFGEIQGAVRKLHSYTTPEIICLPIVDGSADYLRWITDSVKEGTEDATT